MKTLATLLPGVALALAPALAAQAAGPDAMDIHRFLDASQVMAADFTQNDQGEVSSGQVWLGPGGKLRWKQQAPHSLLVVSDGRTGWQVDPDLEQAVRLDARQTQGWTAVFQGRGPDLEKVDADTWRARQDGQPAIEITMGPTGPARIEVDGEFSTSFGQWKAVPAAQAPAFTFTPPPGMDVVGPQPEG